MDLGISTASLSNWRRENRRTLGEVLERIALAGFTGVVFNDPDDSDDLDTSTAITKTRKQCDELGLTVAGYCVSADLLAPLPQQRRVIEKIKKHIDIARELGAPSMRHDVTDGPDPKRSPIGDESMFTDALEKVVPVIRELADYGGSKSVITSIGNRGFFVQSSQRVERALREVDHPNFSLTLNTGNFLRVNEDPVGAVGRLAKYAVSVHINDFHVKPKEAIPSHPDSGWFPTPTQIALRPGIVGHGQIDIPTQIQILKDAGYEGMLSLEFEGIEHPGLAIRLGLSYLRDHVG